VFPDFERGRDRRLWASRKTRSLAELLIDAEEDGMARALSVGMLRERKRRELRSDECHFRWKTTLLVALQRHFERDTSSDGVCEVTRVSVLKLRPLPVVA
jgi:hypothetical protein